MTDNKKNHECGCENDHDHDHDNGGCGCGCGCDNEEMEMMHLALDDGTEVECQVLGVFGVEDKEYIALLPSDDESVLLYGYIEGEEGVELINIEDDSEYDLVVEAFYELFTDEEDDEDDEDYDEEDEEEDEE